MKKIIALLSAAAIFGSSFTVFDGIAANAADGVAINAANFPDINFRYYLQQFDTDGNSVFSQSELTAVEEIDLEYAPIVDLTGIEYFTNLTKLNCYYNKLTSLDVSKNTKLTYLNCGDNMLTSLDVSKNTELEYLFCKSNDLTELDVSKNTKLINLRCESNLIKKIDISKNTALLYFTCGYNQITELDTSKNPALKLINCISNQLEELDVSSNPELSQLICMNNRLTDIDVRNNPKLQVFQCDNNLITYLNVSKNPDLLTLCCSNNKLTTLDLDSTIQILTTLKCDNNMLTSLDVTGFKLYQYSGSENSYNISSLGTYDLSNLPGDFDIERASNWQGATYSNGMITDLSDVITYDYDLGNGKSETFTLYHTPSMFFSDDFDNFIDKTASFEYSRNQYNLDISMYMEYYQDSYVDFILDRETISHGNATASPFDLYWSTYNSGAPATEFEGNYFFKRSNIDALFNTINNTFDLNLSADSYSFLFEGTLYDKNYRSIEYSSLCKIAQRGDATLDHTIDAKDAAAIAKYTANAIISSDATINSTDNELGIFAADTNGDGTIDAKDAANVAKFSSQKALYPTDAPQAQTYWEIWNNILN